jgi:hypothetical protein
MRCLVGVSSAPYSERSPHSVNAIEGGRADDRSCIGLTTSASVFGRIGRPRDSGEEMPSEKIEVKIRKLTRELDEIDRYFYRFEESGDRVNAALTLESNACDCAKSAK